MPLFGGYLAFVALKEAITISFTQVWKWWLGNQLIITELMMKKFSMLGCILLVMANDPYFLKKIGDAAKALSGIINPEEEHHKQPKWVSGVLLVARLLISSLFFYVGYNEIVRQVLVCQ